MNNNVHKTQRYFFEAITVKKLNELFHRADTSDGTESELEILIPNYHLIFH